MPDRSLPLDADVTLPDPTTPPVALPIERQIGEALPRLVSVMRRLLAPGGCPWDREQTYASLKRYVLEEAAEVVDAIDEGDLPHLREELGDLLLQVVFQAELARRDRAFGIDDVVDAIVGKLVHRHPHVFGVGDEKAEVKDSADVLKNWEVLKAKEKGDRGVLEGVPRSLPGLIRAQRVGEKAARVGFDWADIAGSRAKVSEELGELDAAIARNDVDAIEEELGDTLFALVNLARHLPPKERGHAGVDAEAALRRTTEKFLARFSHVETRVREDLGGFSSKPTLEQLDAFWNEAKSQTKGAVAKGEGA
ncbi:MAG: nucleoside triphosphate pyrophosphohydrolase [Polyangiales bacterium]